MSGYFEANLLPLLSPSKLQIFCFLNSAGEFCARVVGTVRLPRPADTLRLTAENRRTVTKDVTVPTRNSHLERSRTAVIEVLGKEPALALFKQVFSQPFSLTHNTY